MVPHKGRLSFKQYIRNKPTRWGINLWVLCEAATGYVYRFQVYLEKKDGNVESKLAQRVARDVTATKHYEQPPPHAQLLLVEKLWPWDGWTNVLGMFCPPSTLQLQKSQHPL